MGERKNTIPEKYQEELKQWKAKHGTVRAISIDDNGNDKVLFFRLPTRPELSAAENMSIDDSTGQMDLYKKAEKMMVDCYLGGDIALEKIMEDVETFMPVAKTVLYDLVKEKKTSLIDC